MFKKKLSQKEYETKLCMGFNGGSMLYKKLAPSNLPLFHAILESLAKKHKQDPIFQGLIQGLQHESSKMRDLRSSQIKKANQHNSKDKNNGWQR